MAFYEQMMIQLDFDAWWVNLIMYCVRLVSCSVALNGHCSGSIVPNRQDDSLSHYLFMRVSLPLSKVYNERASYMVRTKISRSGHSITHLFIAEGSVIFIGANAKHPYFILCHVFFYRILYVVSLIR